jgi:hypothetical protein
VRKPATSVEVRQARVEFEDDEIRVGEEARVRATTPYETGAAVSCIVPGHDRPGTELVNDEVLVADGTFSFELHGTCGFEREFDYAS